MKTLLNPYEKESEFNCFGCSEQNKIGLQMKFMETPEGVISKWKPDKRFEGYFNILHGGIQATMVDEISSWVINMKLDTAGVTSKMEVEYLKPVNIENNEITIQGIIEKVGKREVVINATIYDQNDKLCTKARVTYFLYPKAVAQRKLKYPGKEAYFE
ncbi:MAG: PaaI family thioesterase [Salinivirgaceae bacterium]|nr:PaaI family thioesterase [Salinivirgaceae bacterium]MDD4745991.1 PaaI family thioesterase [Salinivirgaceae bacterium]MDY0280729.1 PaaI family thioesterase [Salinivirgaceae bacterium]